MRARLRRPLVGVEPSLELQHGQPLCSNGRAIDLTGHGAQSRWRSGGRAGRHLWI